MVVQRDERYLLGQPTCEFRSFFSGTAEQGLLWRKIIQNLTKE